MSIFRRVTKNKVDIVEAALETAAVDAPDTNTEEAPSVEIDNAETGETTDVSDNGVQSFQLGVGEKKLDVIMLFDN